MVASTSLMEVDREQWVAFDANGSFLAGKQATGHRKKKKKKTKNDLNRSCASLPAANEMMSKPPSSLVPSSPRGGGGAADGGGGGGGLRHLPSKKNPISPRYFLQPVNPSPDRPNLHKIREGGTDPSKLDSSTDSSSGEEKDGAARPPPPPSSRGQSTSNNNNSSNNKSTISRGRSKNRSLPNTPTEASSRRRSSSRSSKGTRGRSNSRSRPPPTRNNNIRRNRSRSRSASLTRVTGPATNTSSTRSSSNKNNNNNNNNNSRPPSTSQTREELMRRRGRSSSVGPGVTPGVTPRSFNSDEVSADTHPDDNIGRDISFGHHNNRASTLSSSLRNERKNNNSSSSTNSRRPRIMEKLFGDQVEKPTVMAGSPRSFHYEIRPRVLLAATVYNNTATNLWITTINVNQRGVARDPTTANRYLKAFSFSTEREARESAIANAPPKMVEFAHSPNCFICKGKFAVFRRASHCRNCGVCVCSTCSTSWPSKMIPDTYNLKKEANVKICLSCNSLSSAFKNALLDGDYEEAIGLYGTGNINLRTPFPVSSKKDEVMYPIHCAVEGGNINVVRWLIDDHFCPIKLIRTGNGKRGRAGGDVPIHTSKGRSLLSIAIDRVKVDIMRYLVIECGVSIYESTDLKSTLRALEAALIALKPSVDNRSVPRDELPVSTRWDRASFDDISEPSSLGVDEPLIDDRVSVGSKRSSRTKSSRNGESCIICFERKIDCCATPCGHQMCCLECSTNLSACPVCNTRGEFIKIFRP